MKNQLLTLLVLGLYALAACQPTANEQTADAAVVESVAPDYALFDKKIEIIRSYLKAHGDENIEAQTAMLSDTIRWSPPYFNGNEWLGKEDLLSILEAYHNDYDDIHFAEGIIGPTGGDVLNGLWSGSVFPEETASDSPDAIRVYGTWSATHTASGKEIGVKYYALCWVNDDGQIAGWSDYFDVHGLAAQVAAE